MTRAIALFVTIFLFPLLLAGQYLSGISSKWSDAFHEWTLYEGDEPIGELNMRWILRSDWSEWEYRIGEESGTAKLKWKNDPREWEIRGYDELVMAKMIWSDDIREWRISNGRITLTLKSRWGNRLDEWQVREKTYGNFQIYTSWEGDPREWIIVDELAEEISLEMRMALVFIAVFHSVPKG